MNFFDENIFTFQENSENVKKLQMGISRQHLSYNDAFDIYLQWKNNYSYLHGNYYLKKIDLSVPEKV